MQAEEPKQAYDPAQVSMARTYLSELKGQFQSIFKGGAAFNGIITGIKGIAKAAQSAVHAVRPLAKAITAIPRAGLSKVFGGLVEKVQSAAKSFKQFIGSIGRIAMYRAIRSAIKAVTQAFQEGLKTAYEFSKGVAEISGQRFAAAMDSMSSAGLKMKNQLGSVFISLLAAIAPIVNAIISLVTRLADAIAQLFSAFTGGTYLRANDVAKDFADTMKSGGGAAKEWKNQLMGFDEINRLEEPNKGGGGGGGGLLDPSQMFQDTLIDAGIKKFVDDFKAAINAGDWKGAGTLLGEKINEIFPSKEKWAEWGEKLGYGLNGAVSTLYYTLKTIDFVGMGASVATFINNGLSQIDFETWGRTLMRRFTAAVDFFLGLFETLDWTLVGQAIGDFLRGAFYEGIEWLQSKDWEELGKKLFNAVKDLIEGIDFGELAKAFFTLFGEAMKAQAQFSSNFFNAGFDIIKEYFRGKAEECGGDTWAGVEKGITDALRGVVNWAKENVVDPFVNAIKSALGIHSPSTVFMAIGTDIVNGLFNGFSSAWSSFSSWVSGVFNDLITWCQGAHYWLQSVLTGIGLVSGSSHSLGLHSGHSGTFAEGGFPEDGIFFANHGELVGQFSNGKTAVANNAEITAGIANAVYDAFMSAFAVTGGGGNNDREVAIYLDGREIARTTTKYQNQFARAAG